MKKPPKNFLDFLKYGEFSRTKSVYHTDDVGQAVQISLNENQKTQLLAAYIGSKSSFQKLKSTTNTEWKNILNGLVSPNEIEGFLTRKKEIVEAVDAAYARHGDLIFAGPLSPLRKQMPQ